ncbi:MAG: ABC transporter permease [Gammaproteobacteria bacterium]|tara:strand:+ start:400 stop:1773 length:1374 start_codon:yes stop_codon:yes gene_type:complete
MFTFLLTDIFFYIIFFSLILYIYYVRKTPDLKQTWQHVFRNKTGIISVVVLSFFMITALLDSIHIKDKVYNEDKEEYIYSQEIKSILDIILLPIHKNTEKSYSSPFSSHLYSKETVKIDNKIEKRIYPKLLFKGNHNKYSEDNFNNIFLTSLLSIFKTFILVFSICLILCRKNIFTRGFIFSFIQKNKVFLSSLTIMITIIFLLYDLGSQYYILGTDKVGEDVLYKSIKSIRTGILIGTLTTIVMLPFAIFLGIFAGYIGGLIDDIIQYIYTTLNSIPSVLLIASAILMLQVYMSNNPLEFENIYERADLRLFFLCMILGLTSWTGLCRLLRGESMKLREVEYVQASQTFGLKKISIIIRHIIPNIMHIVIITVVLDFSALVLAEAVLSYVNIGVDPTTYSWGNMINAARLEMSREPIVWWSLFSAFLFMFVLVLFANLFSDAVREAFDPRASKNYE